MTRYNPASERPLDLEFERLSLMAEASANHFCLVPAGSAKNFKLSILEPLLRRSTLKCHQGLLAFCAPRVRPARVGVVAPIESDFLSTVHGVSHVCLQTKPMPCCPCTGQFVCFILRHLTLCSAGASTIGLRRLVNWAIILFKQRSQVERRDQFQIDVQESCN
jgi:hypothetical protein